MFPSRKVFLSQGIGMGLGMGMCFIPATAVISHYFHRKRGVAMGISFTGSSVGGAVFPIMLNKLLHNPNWSFGNVIRLLGGIVAGCLIITNLLVKTRLPPRKLRTWEAPPPSVMVLFKDPPFIVASVATVITALGIFFPSACSGVVCRMLSLNCTHSLLPPAHVRAARCRSGPLVLPRTVHRPCSSAHN